MIIGAHIVAATSQQSLLYQSLLQLAKDKPSLGIILLVEETWPRPDDLPVNMSVVNIRPALKNGLLMHYWYNFKLPSLLQKNRVTHFISESGACTIRGRIPQYLMISQISFLQKKPLVPQPHSAYLKRFFPRFLQSANSVLVTENFIADHILQKYPSARDKIKYTGHGLSPVFQPVSWEEKQQFLEDHTDNTEYFISECTEVSKVHLMTLLKAFSLFKKRQKSGMQLLVLMNGMKIEDFVKDLHLYKYREDVKVILQASEPEKAKLIGAAYAAIYLPRQVIVENTGFNALQAGTPLVTIESAEAVSMYGEAALYSALSEKEIAENMMLLYKDEILRNDQITKGRQKSAAYSWPAAADAVWQAVSTG